MAESRGALDKLIDLVKDKLSEAVGALAPQADAIPVPVRDDRPRGPYGPR